MQTSIVIPTYNRLHFLKRTLQAISRLTYPKEDFEVIVVDDGSNDSTDQFLETTSFPFSLRFFKHVTNRFASASRNTGIKCARGEIIVFLDDDMEVVPDFLEEHLKFHGDGQRVVVAGNIQVGRNIQPTGIVRYQSTRGVHKLKRGQKMPFKYWCSGNASIRKSVLYEVGFFDEEIHQYGGEDLELAYRLEKRGNVFFMYSPRAISYHMYYREFSDVCRLMFNYGQTSLAYMIQKHPELAKTVRAHLIEPLRLGRDSFLQLLQKLLIKAGLNPVFYAPIKWYTEKSKSGLPAFAYDYIIAYNYLTGLRKSLCNKNVPFDCRDENA